MTEVIIKNGDKRKYDLPIGTLAVRQNTEHNGYWDGEKTEKTSEGMWDNGGISPFRQGDFHIQNPQLVIELLLDQVKSLKTQLQQEQLVNWHKQDRINDIISFVTGDEDWQKVEEGE